MIRTYILLPFVLLFWAQYAVSQDLERGPEGEVEDAEIVIEKDRIISLPRADKIIHRIEALPPLEEPERRGHQVKTFDYNLDVDLPEIETLRPETSETEDGYNHYVKAGFGNYTSPLINARFNIASSKNKALGLSLEHESFGGGEKDGENSASAYSSVGISGALLFDKTRLSSQINYSRSKNYFYGYADVLEVNRDTIEHTYNFLDADVTLEDINATDDLSYDAKIRVRSASDNFDASETTISIIGNVGIGNKLFLEGLVDLSNYKDVQDVSRNHFRFKGYYRMDGLDDLIVDAGIMFSAQNDENSVTSPSQVFPYLNANYKVSPTLSLVAKVDAGYRFNTYYQLAQENFYLGANVPVQNTEIKFRGLLGIEGKPADQWRFGANASLMSVENLLQLNNDFGVDSARFTSIYNPQSTTVLSIAVSSGFILNKNHSLQFEGKVTNYSSDTQEEVYHLPGLEFSLSGQHQVMDPVTLKWNFKFVGGLNAFNTLAGSAVELDAIPELNLGLDYQISDKAGAFMSINNLLNSKFERYLNYRERGLQIRAGLSYRF